MRRVTFFFKANCLLFKRHLAFVTFILQILKHPLVLLDCLCNFNAQGHVFYRVHPWCSFRTKVKAHQKFNMFSLLLQQLLAPMSTWLLTRYLEGLGVEIGRKATSAIGPALWSGSALQAGPCTCPSLTVQQSFSKYTACLRTSRGGDDYEASLLLFSLWLQLRQSNDFVIFLVLGKKLISGFQTFWLPPTVRNMSPIVTPI